MIRSFSHDEIAAALDNDELEMLGVEEGDEDATALKQVGYYLGSMSLRYEAFLNRKGITLTDDAVIFTRSDETLHLADLRQWVLLCHLVFWDYEGSGHSGEEVEPKDPRHAWNLLGLSGDDDVDYNDSYPSMITPVLFRLLGGTEDGAAFEKADRVAIRDELAVYIETMLWDRKLNR